MYREYAQGKIKLDPSVVDKPLSLLERIPDDEYKAILRPYADKIGLGDKFYEAAINRKNNARAEFDRFFARLEKDRSMRAAAKALIITRIR